MTNARETTGKLLKIARRAIAIAVAMIIAVAIAMFVFFRSPTFQAALKEQMKESVPKGWFHGWVCLWTGCNPFKVVDPDDPRFKPERFQFEDYGTERQLAYAISRIITPGTERETVEEILVKSGCASIDTTHEEKAVYYSYPDKAEKIDRGVWVVAVSYPDGTHVGRVWVHGTEVTSNGKESRP